MKNRSELGSEIKDKLFKHKCEKASVDHFLLFGCCLVVVGNIVVIESDCPWKNSKAKQKSVSIMYVTVFWWYCCWWCVESRRKQTFSSKTISQTDAT